MKIDLDLTEVFESDDGEQIKVSMADRIIDAVADRCLKGFTEKLNATVEQRLSDEVDKALIPVLESKIGAIFDNLLDYEFRPVSNYGRRDKPTTLRNRIIDAIEENTGYKKTTWESEKNVFTKKVDEVISREMGGFRDIITKELTSEFKKACISEAAKLLASKL